MSRRKPKNENSMPGHADAADLIERGLRVQEADTMGPDYDEEGLRRRPQEKANDKPAALQGLTDDPCGRVAEAVYAQVFAATWVKRQDLSADRTTASVEASLAMHAARGAYAVEINAKPEEQA